MKNEVMAKAMTGIDDQLIVAAHADVRKTQKRNFIPWLGAAAGIVLVIGSTFLPKHTREIEILIHGHPINGPVIVQDAPAVVSEDISRSVSNHISVPVEIKTSEPLQIRAVHGILEVYSLKTNQLLCVGQFCNVEESVRINWIIDEPEEDKTYQLQLGKQAGILKLTYDKEINNWTIIK